MKDWILYWRGSVSDLATDIAGLLSAGQLRELSAELEERAGVSVSIREDARTQMLAALVHPVPRSEEPEDFGSASPRAERAFKRELFCRLFPVHVQVSALIDAQWCWQQVQRAWRDKPDDC